MLAVRNANPEDITPPNTWFAVTGLGAINVGGGHAFIEWTKSTGPVAGYEIIVCTLYMPRQCQKADVNETRQKLTNLRPDTTYFAKVRPFDDTRPQRHYGEQVSINFTTRSLPVVRGLKAKALSATIVSVEWTAPEAHVDGYRVNALSTGAGSVDVVTNRTSVQLSDLVPEHEYDIHVQTLNQEEGGIAYGAAVTVSAKTSTLRPPRDVHVLATCDRDRVVASWKYSGDPLTGFEMELCDEQQHSCVKDRASASAETASLAVPTTRRNYTFRIQSCLLKLNTLHLSAPVVRKVETFGEATPVDDLQAHIVNDTSLKVTWGTAHTGEILIRVCPISSQKNCTYHVTEGSLLEYQIDDIGHDAVYHVHASFSTSVGSVRCLHRESLFTVKRHASGERNSSPRHEVYALVLGVSLLLPVLTQS